jgi:hypothetical protein
MLSKQTKTSVLHFQLPKLQSSKISKNSKTAAPLPQPHNITQKPFLQTPKSFTYTWPSTSNHAFLKEPTNRSTQTHIHVPPSSHISKELASSPLFYE